MNANPEIETNLKNTVTNAIGKLYPFEITSLEIITADIVKDPYSVFTENSLWTTSISGEFHDIRIIQDKTWNKIEFIYSARHGLTRFRMSVEHGVVLVAAMIRHTLDFGEPKLLLGVGTLDRKGDIVHFLSTSDSLFHLQPDWNEDSIGLTTFKKSREIFSENAWRYLNPTNTYK
ncbi:hypothetical protein V6259_13120 [Marinomonas sp. TI.3.20]|uniref:hypothetical protein n=1 Tax=Marinomonas sp. TI.3.20 TaxID=3121296 RepID=UPI00311D5348